MLVILTVDSAHPTCATHSDCHAGQMCNGFFMTWGQPRCEPCSFLGFLPPCENDRISDSDLDLGDFFESSWFDSYLSPNVDTESYNFSDIFTSQEEAMMCISEQYCLETTPSGIPYTLSSCPYIREIIAKTSKSAFAILFVMSMLFSTYFCKDMREAEVENALLDFIISSEPASSLSFALFILRVTNRTRRYWLSYYTAMAAAAIILTDDISPKNVTLNLLALVFFIEADNLMGNMFPKNQIENAESLVKAAKRNNVRIKQSDITREALYISLSMFLACFFIEELLKLPSPVECTVDFALGTIFMVVSPLLVLL